VAGFLADILAYFLTDTDRAGGLAGRPTNVPRGSPRRVRSVRLAVQWQHVLPSWPGHLLVPLPRLSPAGPPPSGSAAGVAVLLQQKRSPARGRRAPLQETPQSIGSAERLRTGKRGLFSPRVAGFHSWSTCWRCPCACAAGRAGFHGLEPACRKLRAALLPSPAFSLILAATGPGSLFPTPSKAR
jgi:hypothetical protein